MHPSTYSFAFAGLVLVAAATMFAMPGCGNANPKVVPVKGVVKLGGKPLAGGVISTIPTGGRGAKATIQPDGTFELGTYDVHDGAVPGTHHVFVIAREPSTGSGPEAPPGKLLIPAKYTDPLTSELTIEVKPGEENHPVLELSSK
jgi:hypothetical protein